MDKLHRFSGIGWPNDEIRNKHSRPNTETEEDHHTSKPRIKLSSAVLRSLPPVTLNKNSTTTVKITNNNFVGNTRASLIESDESSDEANRKITINSRVTSGKVVGKSSINASTTLTDIDIHSNEPDIVDLLNATESVEEKNRRPFEDLDTVIELISNSSDSVTFIDIQRVDPRITTKQNKTAIEDNDNDRSIRHRMKSKKRRDHKFHDRRRTHSKSSATNIERDARGHSRSSDRTIWKRHRHRSHSDQRRHHMEHIRHTTLSRSRSRSKSRRRHRSTSMQRASPNRLHLTDNENGVSSTKDYSEMTKSSRHRSRKRSRKRRRKRSAVEEDKDKFSISLENISDSTLTQSPNTKDTLIEFDLSDITDDSNLDSIGPAIEFLELDVDLNSVPEKAEFSLNNLSNNESIPPKAEIMFKNIDFDKAMQNTIQQFDNNEVGVRKSHTIVDTFTKEESISVSDTNILNIESIRNKLNEVILFSDKDQSKHTKEKSDNYVSSIKDKIISTQSSIEAKEKSLQKEIHKITNGKESFTVEIPTSTPSLAINNLLNDDLPFYFKENGSDKFPKPLNIKTDVKTENSDSEKMTLALNDKVHETSDAMMQLSPVKNDIISINNNDLPTCTAVENKEKKISTYVQNNVSKIYETSFNLEEVNIHSSKKDVEETTSVAGCDSADFKTNESVTEEPYKHNMFRLSVAVDDSKFINNENNLEPSKGNKNDLSISKFSTGSVESQLTQEEMIKGTKNFNTKNVLKPDEEIEEKLLSTVSRSKETQNKKDTSFPNSTADTNKLIHLKSAINLNYLSPSLQIIDKVTSEQKSLKTEFRSALKDVPMSEDLCFTVEDEVSESTRIIKNTAIDSIESLDTDLEIIEEKLESDWSSNRKTEDAISTESKNIANTVKESIRTAIANNDESISSKSSPTKLSLSSSSLQNIASSDSILKEISDGDKCHSFMIENEANDITCKEAIDQRRSSMSSSTEVSNMHLSNSEDQFYGSTDLKNKNIEMLLRDKCAEFFKRPVINVGGIAYMKKIKSKLPILDTSSNDIRDKLKEQLELLRNQRNDATFATSKLTPTIPITPKKIIIQRSMTEVQNPVTEDVEIKDSANSDTTVVVNEDLSSKMIWLTKTTDYQKIKGWKNKMIRVPIKKPVQNGNSSITEDLAVPSCSYHVDRLSYHMENNSIYEPNSLDDVIENVVSDKKTHSTPDDNIISDKKPFSLSDENTTAAHLETSDVKNSAFSSSVLDGFLNENADLEISYRVPELLMGPKISESAKVHEYFFKEDSAKEEADPIMTKELAVKEKYKPRTVAEMRKLLAKHAKNNNKNQEIFSKSIEISDTTDVNVDDEVIDSTRTRNDFAVGSVYFKSKRYLVPCKEKKVVYFRVKVPTLKFTPTYNSDNEEIDEKKSTVTEEESITAEAVVPVKSTLWKPEKSNIPKKTIIKQYPKSSVTYKAGPLSKKPQLIEDQSNSWLCVIKQLPKVFLTITAESLKSVHPRALQFLYANNAVDLSADRVEFALTALVDSKPIKYTIPVSYKNNQTHITVRKKISPIVQTKIPPLCKNIDSEVQGVIDDMLNCVDIQEIQETFIKDDPECNSAEVVKEVSPRKLKLTETKTNTKVAAINKSLRLALNRLQVKFIDINIDEDPNKQCDKSFCQLGCVCNSLLGAFSSKVHCSKIDCIFHCVCGYKPPPNTTVNLPHGSDLGLSSTVDKLQSEATKNLAKVEKEFTQTIVCTKNETYVLGDTTDRRRRCTKAPKKYADFLNVNEDIEDVEEEAGTITRNKDELDSVMKRYGVALTGCFVSLEEVDMSHIIPFCWEHFEYNCSNPSCLIRLIRDDKKLVEPAQTDNLTRVKYMKRTKTKWSFESKDDHVPNKLPKLQTNAVEPDKYLEKHPSPVLDPILEGASAPKKVKGEISRKLQRKKYKLKQKLTQRKFSIKHQSTVKGTEQNSHMKNYVFITEKDTPKETVSNNTTTQDEEDDPLKVDVDPILENTSKSNQAVLQTAVTVNNVQEKRIEAKSCSRRKQILSTKSDSEVIEIVAKKVYDEVEMEPPHSVDADLKFYAPNKEVRLQFLKMLGKSNNALDQFRLLPFMVLANRFHRNMLFVWYSRTAANSKYVVTTENVSPAPDFYNVRYFSEDMKSDNYLIQWLMEPNLRTQKIKDMLVILRVVDDTYEICGMCEKNKLSVSEESFIQQPLVNPSTARADAPKKMLNIQHQNLQYLLCVYPTVPLTGHNGLVNVSLPIISPRFRWLMVSIASGFAVFNMTATNYCIPHESVVQMLEKSRLGNCTVLLKNKSVRGKAAHEDFAIYAAPQISHAFFVGPWHMSEELACETLCYYKNMLVSTDNFNRIHGNTPKAIGSWLKQLQMKVHTVADTPMEEPKMIIRRKAKSLAKLKQSIPPVRKEPPELVKISDYIASKKDIPLSSGKKTPSTNTSLLIRNNAVIGTSTMTVNQDMEGICLRGLDYRDAEFKDKTNKRLLYYYSNIPGLGYVRLYICQSTNIIYLMWRFVKTFKSVQAAEAALKLLIENTVIILPSTFKITLTLTNEAPKHMSLINSDLYFETYIAGKFGIEPLHDSGLDGIRDKYQLSESDVEYVAKRSSGMLLKKCYNIASTFLTKEHLSLIRNWKDMMIAVKTQITHERDAGINLEAQLAGLRSKQTQLRAKLNSLETFDRNFKKPVSQVSSERSSEVIEISDDDEDDDSPDEDNEEENSFEVPVQMIPKANPEFVSVSNLKSLQAGMIKVQKLNPITPSIQMNKLPVINTHVISSAKRLGFVSMAQNISQPIKLMKHTQKSVLIKPVSVEYKPVTTTKTNNY